jgi:CheY-like chemotaxis protein
MQSKRILIVDDEPAFIRLLRLNLERTGRYLVCEVHDAAQALEVAADFKPDLILLDLIMPKRHGGEIAESVRSDPVLGHTPIVFLTASAWKSNDLPNSKIAGCTVISKPASMVEVIHAIETNLTPDAAEQAAVPESRSESSVKSIRRLGFQLVRALSPARWISPLVRQVRTHRATLDDSSPQRGASPTPIGTGLQPAADRGNFTRDSRPMSVRRETSVG